MCEISIIVPVYNIEKYLDKCIKSILDQTFKNFELILVNDGSTDKSGDICDKYKFIDNRVVVIHKENGGTSSARNIGLDIAKGKYIGFVDGDDYIDENMYYELYEVIINSDSDISMCKSIKIYDNNKFEKNNNILKENYSNIQSLEELFGNNSMDFVVPWNKLYRKDLISKFRYPLGRKYEDAFIIHRLLYECNKITCINKALYYYYQREGSAMHSEISIKDIDLVYFNLDRIKFFNSINENKLKENSIYFFVSIYFGVYRNVKYVLKDKYSRKKLKRLMIKNYNYIFRSNNFSLKEKISILIFILNEDIYYSKIEKRKS